MSQSPKTSLVIHAHFYQPPRENPWTGDVCKEPSASPYHDWNERIQHECYRPNARARVLDNQGRIERVVDNYELLSFNVGPTLMTWMESHDHQTYERILQADRASVAARSGHGNAIAQAYGHAILPLCNERDCRTHVRWGIADFVHRFKRRPEAMWLPETACNDHTLGVLIDEGMSFVILSPYQANAVRPLKPRSQPSSPARASSLSHEKQPGCRCQNGARSVEGYDAQEADDVGTEFTEPTELTEPCAWRCSCASPSALSSSVSHVEQLPHSVEQAVQHRASCFPAALDGSEESAAGDEALALQPVESYECDEQQAWSDVSDGSIDPGVAYQYEHTDGSGRSLAVFFYDGPIARSIAFEGSLSSSDGLLDHLGRGAVGEGRIVHVATDGESYGHHFAGGERCLAYALDVLAERRGFHVTNYGEYLQHHPPRMQVQIKEGPGGEGTAWSCAHGVGRWRRDCGCTAGSKDGWTQAWRGPLREALDYLRDRAIEVFEQRGAGLFVDPWRARDGYIEVINGQVSREAFLYEHAGRHLRDSEQFEALALLEMQRNALLMYTSCGWFFADISGIETLQDLRYAARVMDWMQELEVPSPREKFLEILSHARSNVPEHGSGADVFERLVEPARVTPFRIGAHLAIIGLGKRSPSASGVFCGYLYTRKNTRIVAHGRLAAYTGRLCLESQLVPQRMEFAVVAMHLGGIDFYGAMKVFPGMQRFEQSEKRFWSAFQDASLTTLLRVAHEEFGPDEFDLSAVLPQGHEQAASLVFGKLLERFAEQYAHLYDDNARIIEKVQEAGFELPIELRVAAEFTLGRRFMQQVRDNLPSHDPRAYDRAVKLADHAARRGYHLDRQQAVKDFEQRIADAVDVAIGNPSVENVQRAMALVDVASKLGLDLSLDAVQDAVLDACHAGGKKANGAGDVPTCSNESASIAANDIAEYQAQLEPLAGLLGLAPIACHDKRVDDV